MSTWLAEDVATRGGGGLEGDVTAMVHGLSASIVALVATLEGEGAVTPGAYRRHLLSLWHGLPEEVALGEAGGVIEGLLDGLDKAASPAG